MDALLQMTDQYINEAIALACGWTRVGAIPETDIYVGLHPDHAEFSHLLPLSNIPNYCTDLNAIVPVVAKLTGASVGAFEEYLGEITGTGALALRRSFVGERFNLTIATARQLCEAFLRTIGKWKEESK
jgi:hypothetical protein